MKIDHIKHPQILQFDSTFVYLNSHEDYMYRCLNLANLSKSEVFPNPMVGSLIVDNHRIIGEGYHQTFGAAHAEVNAISSVKDTSVLPQSTLYVNLEPCCHWGKTPPCTDLIIRSGIKHVVIGCLDPNPLVAGRGVKKLEEAGIKVTTKVLENECLTFNHRFFKHILQTPTIDFIVKWAESKDGFIGKSQYKSAAEREISNEITKRWVHKLRSEVDGLMIGTNTALIDDPLLNNRYWFGKTPNIILLDKELKIPLTSQLFKSKSKIFILTQQTQENTENKVFLKLNFEQDTVDFWNHVSRILIEQNIFSVLLEGGAFTIQSFLQSELAANIYRIRSNKNLENGIKAPSTNLSPVDRFEMGNNTVELLKKYAI